jgi:hypothetical protein
MQSKFGERKMPKHEKKERRGQKTTTFLEGHIHICKIIAGI